MTRSVAERTSPSPAEIKAARKAAKLTQTAAAAKIGKPLKTWQNWEAPETSPSHRGMDPALWELFLIKINNGREK